VGCPSSEATGDGKGTRLTEEDAGGIASDRTIEEEEEARQWTL
jgi:hypothetical protein